MFDTTFAEVLVVITAAGLLLGRKELTYASRMIGRGLGKIVGTLQGVRIKYEEKTRGTRIYQLHQNVKDGLSDMGTIGADLSSLGRGVMQGGIAHSGRRGVIGGSPAPTPEPYISTPAYSPNPSASVAASSAFVGTRGIASPAGLPSATPAAGALYGAGGTLDASNTRLAQLILAEEQLAERARQQGRGRRNEGGIGHASAASSTSSDGTCTVDLVESCIVDSILNAAYESQARAMGLTDQQQQQQQQQQQHSPDLSGGAVLR